MTTGRVAPLFVMLIFVVGVPPTAAQSPAPRFEVGAHAALLRLTDSDATHAGLGGRFTFDLSRWVAADVELTFFPNDDVELPASVPATFPGPPPFALTHHRRRADGFFGIRTGTRGRRVGAFARVRPGFTRLLDRGIECTGPGCAVILLARPQYRTELAFDLGGGFEWYPSGRTVARIELGDIMIRHRRPAPPCPAGDCTSHNFSTRIGGGFRF